MGPLLRYKGPDGWNQLTGYGHYCLVKRTERGLVFFSRRFQYLDHLTLFDPVTVNMWQTSHGVDAKPYAGHEAKRFSYRTLAGSSSQGPGRRPFSVPPIMYWPSSWPHSLAGIS